MELIVQQSLPVNPNPNTSRTLTFKLPAWPIRWTFHITPVGSNSPTDCTVDVAGEVMTAPGVGTFYPFNPDKGPIVCPANKISLLTGEDALGTVKFTIADGVTPSDGGVIIQLRGTRTTQ